MKVLYDSKFVQLNTVAIFFVFTVDTVSKVEVQLFCYTGQQLYTDLVQPCVA